MGTAIFLDVGCADTSIIIAGSNYFMVDCYDPASYLQHLPKGKRITGLFITHQHRDHFSGMCYLADNGYSIDYLIYSPYRRRYDDSSVEYDEWKEFDEYKDYFVRQGTKSYSPYRQEKFHMPWWLISGLSKSGVHDSVPHPTALKRYNDHTEKVYRTDVEGTLSCDFYLGILRE